MAKYKKIEEPVFIVKCASRGSRHGGDIWEVDFKGIVSRKDFKSYIDPTNMNWRRWEPIVDIAQRKGVVLGNLKEKDVGLVNADSEVKVHYVVEPEELAEILAEFWDNQNTFSKLFK